MHFLAAPKWSPPLDPDFRPPTLARAHFRRELDLARSSQPLVFALEREAGQVSLYKTLVFADAHPHAEHNAAYAERLLKTLLWQRGAGRVLVAGPSYVCAELSAQYARNGARAFDASFFSEVYERDFSVEPAAESSLPAACESSRRLGGHFGGCRIGFDAGGSDCKVAALNEGKTVFSEEVAWLPKEQADPSYHRAVIRDCIAKARAHLPRIDAIGVSSAGIFVDNRTRVASLFRRVPRAQFEAQVRNIYADLAREFDAPVEVANDGDVAALAGALELGEGALLGLAFGTSLAAGFVDAERRVTGWLNELAFAPHDLSPNAPIDEEWSFDRGTGVNYLSQDAALRLAPRAGIALSKGTRAEQLRELQSLAQEGHDGALQVFESLGVYLGYALLDYAEFYPMRSVQLLGRVTSGVAGARLLNTAERVLRDEAPELAARLRLWLPDEASRRVGQAIAAASLPAPASNGAAR